jgi:hypothetical protein
MLLDLNIQELLSGQITTPGNEKSNLGQTGLLKISQAQQSCGHAINVRYTEN